MNTAVGDFSTLMLELDVRFLPKSPKFCFLLKLFLHCCTRACIVALIFSVRNEFDSNGL